MHYFSVIFRINLVIMKHSSVKSLAMGGDDGLDEKIGEMNLATSDGDENEDFPVLAVLAEIEKQGIPLLFVSVSQNKNSLL